MACRVGSKSQFTYSEIVEAGRIAVQCLDSDGNVGGARCVVNEGRSPNADVVIAGCINLERINSYRDVDTARRVGSERIGADGNVGVASRIGRECSAADGNTVKAGCV